MFGDDPQPRSFAAIFARYVHAGPGDNRILFSRPKRLPREKTNKKSATFARYATYMPRRLQIPSVVRTEKKEKSYQLNYRVGRMCGWVCVSQRKTLKYFFRYRHTSRIIKGGLTVFDPVCKIIGQSVFFSAKRTSGQLRNFISDIDVFLITFFCIQISDKFYYRHFKN